MEGEKQGRKILMVPWLAHSHATPFFELAKKLISKSNNYFHIYLCSTPVVLNFLKQSQGKYLSENVSNVELIELNLPSSLELPSYHHTTEGLPEHLRRALVKSFQMHGRESFSNIVNNINPDLIIDDLFQTWAPEIGFSRNIPVVQLFVSSAAFHCFIYHLYLHDGATDDFPFPEICPPDYAIDVLCSRTNASSLARRIDKHLGFGARKMSSDIILINNWKETEAKYMPHLSFITNKKILGVGPLLAQIDQNTTTTTTTEDDMIIDQWLDKRDRFSTVYVLFGSECIWSKAHIQEIAHGLELSNVNFLWVLRYPGCNNVEEILPQGFEERVKERGLVVSKWVPHAKIMGHPSVGGFFTHCGWNSTLECIHFGVPIIAMPNNADQFVTAKYVANVLGNGLEVERDETLSMKREDIAKAIREIILEKGEQMRERSRELSDKMRKEEDKDIEQEVVEELICLMKKNEINNY